MRRVLIVASLVTLLVALPASAEAQPSSQEPRFELEFVLDPSEGNVDIELEVTDRANLATLQLGFGNLDRLQGEPTLEGDWDWEPGAQWAVADLEATPNAKASWTSDGQISTQTFEGEGHTSYVGEEFAIVRAGQMVPSIRYNFQPPEPSFQTTLTVRAPEGWTVAGPWEESGERSFQTGTPIPRGFLVADDDLEEIRLGDHEDPYRIVRTEHAQEAEHTEQILLTAREFLTGLYSEVVHQRFIVVGPDPMFRGGLASPDGVFLHADADESIVAHEMVHAYQGWQFSRGPDATIWLAEGTAEVHGKLLEVASGLTTRQEALDWLEETHDEATTQHGVDLRTAVYGSGNERAAYEKGAVVVTALNDEIRDATRQEYTLADVLRHTNEATAEQGRNAWGDDRFTNQDLEDVIHEVTGTSLTAFFDRYVYGTDVPRAGGLFPGEAAIRLLDTDPSPVVAEQPFTVRVALTNLDTRETTVELPVLVDGTQNGTLKATLPAGASVQASADVDPQPRGSYSLRVQDSTLDIDVVRPAEPHVTLDIWPREPDDAENVTLGARINNTGEAPYHGPVTVHLDGVPQFEQDHPVQGGQWRTFTHTLAPQDEGVHRVEALAPNGTLLAHATFNVTAPDDPDPTPSDEQQDAPGVPVLATMLVTAITAAIRRAR